VLEPVRVLNFQVTETLDTPSQPSHSQDLCENDGEQPKLYESACCNAALAGIDGAIDRLNRLSIAIRRSSGRKLTARSSSDYLYFRRLAKDVVKILYPAAEEELQDMLGTCMADRCDRVMSVRARNVQFSQRRQSRDPQRLEVVAEEMDMDDQQDAGPVKAVKAEQHSPLRAHVIKTTPPTIARKHVGSLSEISSVDPELVHQMMSGPSNAGSSKRGTSSIHINQTTYPKPLPVAQDPHYFACPYCGEMRTKQSYEGSEWKYVSSLSPCGPHRLIMISRRKHVENDLKPYICISEKCCEPIQSFSTFRSWHGHMLSQHGLLWHQDAHPTSSWVCPLCHNTAEPFNVACELYRHMKETHQLTEEQLDAIVQMSRIRVRRRPDICPLCGLHVEDDTGAQVTMEDTKSRPTDPNKRSQDSPLLESITKRFRQDPDTGLLVSPEPPGPPLDRRVEEAGNKSRVELMARHVASHLQMLMLLNIKLLSVRDSRDDEGTSIASSSAVTGDNSTRQTSLYFHNSEDDTTGNEDESDQGSIPQGNKGNEVETDDQSGCVPNTEYDVDWSTVKTW